MTFAWPATEGLRWVCPVFAPLLLLAAFAWEPRPGHAVPHSPVACGLLALAALRLRFAAKGARLGAAA